MADVVVVAADLLAPTYVVAAVVDVVGVIATNLTHSCHCHYSTAILVSLPPTLCG